jgi:hypothetical protein
MWEKFLPVLPTSRRRLHFVVLLRAQVIFVLGLFCARMKRPFFAHGLFSMPYLKPIFMLRCDAGGAMSYSYLSATMGSTLVARRAGM